MAARPSSRSTPRRSKPRPKGVTGVGWSGTYYGERQLGWLVSEFVDTYPHNLNHAQRMALGLDANTRGVAASNMYRVRITITPLKDKRGRYIVKRTRRKDGC